MSSPTGSRGVILPLTTRLYPLNYYSKSQASVLAVAERQSLDTLSRDEKIAARTVAQLQDKIEQLTTRRTKLGEDEETAKRRRTEVCGIFGTLVPITNCSSNAFPYSLTRKSRS